MAKPVTRKNKVNLAFTLTVGVIPCANVALLKESIGYVKIISRAKTSETFASFIIMANGMFSNTTRVCGM